MNRDVIIVGGGPAGLATAFWHQRGNPQSRVLMCESSDRAGGWLRSERRDGYLCENGPQAVRPNQDFNELIAALGIENELVAASRAASTRWIGRDGGLRAVPRGPLGLITSRLLSWRGKLRLLRELREPKVYQPASESVSAFCARRFGPETVEMVQAMVNGVFAGDADRLEVDSAFPMLSDLEREHGSVLRGLKHRRNRQRASGAQPGPSLVTFRGGMADLTRHLATAVGDALVCGAAVSRVEHFDAGWTVTMADGETHRAPHLVLACPARISAKLLTESAPQLATELAAIQYASLASVYLGIPSEHLPRKLRGFGFLLTPTPHQPVLGTIYASELFPDHAPAGHALLRVMLGGTRHPEAVARDDAQLIALAMAAIAKHTGLITEPTFRHCVRCNDAIPQYEIGHQQRLRRINDQLSRLPGLELRGNSYGGVAVTAQLGRRVAPHQRASEAQLEVIAK